MAGYEPSVLTELGKSKMNGADGSSEYQNLSMIISFTCNSQGKSTSWHEMCKIRDFDCGYASCCEEKKIVLKYVSFSIERDSSS